MFFAHSLARFLPAAALAALGFCFTQGAFAFPSGTTNPTSPPSTSPTNSGGLNNFKSTFEYSFSDGHGTGFTPNARIDCRTCRFPVDTNAAHTFRLTGRVLGWLKDPPARDPREGTFGVFDMIIEITGVKAEILSTIPVPGQAGYFDQTISYTGNLVGGVIGGQNFNAAVSGTFTHVPTVAPVPTNPALPENAVISIGAEAGTTPGLVTAGPTPTFPGIADTDPGSLGQGVAPNVVFQVTETKRVRIPPPIE